MSGLRSFGPHAAPGTLDADTPAAPPVKKNRRRLRRIWERASAPVFALLVLLVWQIGAPLAGISEFVLPTPWQIIRRIVTDYRLLGEHAVVTALEVVSGFGLAVVLGMATGLAIFYSRLFERTVYPLLVALQTIPKVALAPLLVLYLGYAWAPKIFLAFLIAFFPIVIATAVGLQSLDKSMINLIRSMGATETQAFFKLRLPMALPGIFGGFKVAIGMAVIGAVIGEYVAAEKGLGYLQMQAASKFDTTLSFAAVTVISALGVLLFALVGFLEDRLTFKREAAL